jgi:hypothetical protein
MVWVPMVRVETLMVAEPAALTGAEPSTAVPSENVIVPVAPAVVVAVKITVCPGLAGFADDVSVMFGVDFATVTIVAGEVAEFVVGPSGIEAVMGLDPRGSDGTVSVATPLTTAEVPSKVPLS